MNTHPDSKLAFGPHVQEVARPVLAALMMTVAAITACADAPAGKSQPEAKSPVPVIEVSFEDAGTLKLPEVALEEDRDAHLTRAAERARLMKQTKVLLGPVVDPQPTLRIPVEVAAPDVEVKIEPQLLPVDLPVDVASTPGTERCGHNGVVCELTN